MRTISKIVLIVVLIVLVYSLVKLISAATIKGNTFTFGTWYKNQSSNIPASSNQSNTQSSMKREQNIPPSPDIPNAQGLYQADEILIDGQGKAGQNYIDITSDTPITPQNVSKTQSNQYNNSNGGGNYAQATVMIDHNNNTNTSVQTYAPAESAFEVFDGN